MTLIAETLGASALSPEPWVWPRGVDARQHWAAWARDAAQWLSQQGADPRQAMVVVPVGALLPLVRLAWSDSVGGWLPIIDTIAGLVQQHAWRHVPSAPDVGQESYPALTLDAVVDRLAVHAALRGLPWVRAWDRSQPRALRFAIEQVVAMGHGWWRRLQACPPSDRDVLMADWLAELPMPGQQPDQESGTPGQLERWLMAWGLRWTLHQARQGCASDVLFELRPSAWLIVTAGQAVLPGSEGALTLAVAQRAARGDGPGYPALPCRWWAATAEPNPLALAPSIASATDLEDEARMTASQILHLVAQSRSTTRAAEEDEPMATTRVEPVALIALDRGVVRRVRALLDERGVLVADETGWKLSTTRAAAVLSRTMSAANPRASTDEVLDWLKSAWVTPPGGVDAVAALEHWCRRRGVLSLWGATSGASPLAGPAAALELVAWAQQALAPLSALWSQGRAPLSQWLSALRDALQASQSWTALQADPAGQQAIDILRMDDDEPGADQGAWQGLIETTRMDGRAALAWLQELLEGAVFRPTVPPGTVPDVVVTTLARAALRPFLAVVMPGADVRQLGGLPVRQGWLSQVQRERMGLGTAQDQQQAQWEAFELVMCAPAIVCLHRQDHDGELLSASPWLERWQARHGQAWQPAADDRRERHLNLAPVSRPAPQVHQHLSLVEPRMTATRYEALRQCPYQFFAKAILALEEAEELEEGVDGADYGNVLHLILQRFHEQRDQQRTQRSLEQELTAWMDAAQHVMESEGMAHEANRPFFRPYQQQLERLAWAYLSWLLPHEREGWSVKHMEFQARQTVVVGDQVNDPGGEPQALVLEGRLDRMDVRHRTGTGQERHVIDYKSGQLDQLKKKLKTPLEDTQLLFYALLGGEPEGLQASYLHLGKDSSSKAEAGAMKATLLTHDEVSDHADRLLEGLVHDWQRIRQGHGLAALGEGATCTHCRYRGLCRQDDWSAP
ncbi:MAG: PD-(D/E)XK nuclease family protein [Aquabacterium sp.]